MKSCHVLLMIDNGRASLVHISPRNTVLVVQRRLTHYRVPFFEALRMEMATRNIDLVLAHGDPTAEEAAKQDGGELSWARRIRTTYLFGGRVCWQPFGALARQSDLVVLTHENKLVCNVAAQYFLRRSKVALWGHGANLQGDAASLRERFKRHTARQADWWFGYTQLSLPLIKRSGFPTNRTTILNNSIDTVALMARHAAVTPLALDVLRSDLRLAGHSVGVFLGSLYADKKIRFLLEAALAVRAAVPGFELVIAGGGPDRSIVETFCARHDWARYAGVQSGQRKAELLALAKVILNPGLVGLGILDSFACQVPMVTTDCGLHSPEIAYLDDGVNGVMTADSIPDYVGAVVRVLTESAHRAALVEGCVRSTSKYTVNNMVRRFCDGVEQCLAAPMYRWAA